MSKSQLYTTISSSSSGDPVWEAVTRTNPIPVTVTDSAGRQAKTTFFAEQVVGTRRDDVSVQFQYGIATYDVTTSTVNNGTVTGSSSLALIQSSTNASGSAKVYSNHAVRYRPGHDAFANFTANFTATGAVGSQVGVAGCNQYIGIYNDVDGFMVGFTGANFSVVKRRGGVDSVVTRANFNMDTIDGTGKSGFNIDFTKLNVFRISYGWLGASPIVFEVMHDLGHWIPFHIIRQPNSQTGVSVLNPVLTIKAEVTKASGATNVSLMSGSWNGGTIGPDRDEAGRLFAYSRTKTIGGSSYNNIFTIKASTSFQGHTNHIHSALRLLSAACDGTKIARIHVIRNGTLTGSSYGTSIDSTNSVMKVDTVGAITEGSGVKEAVMILGKAGNDHFDLSNQNIHINAGETITLAARSSGASDVSIAVRWEEEF